MKAPGFFLLLWLSSSWVSGSTAKPEETLGTLQELSGVMKSSMTLTHESVNAKLLEGAIRGMTWALDRHTNYFSIQEAKDFMAMIKGGFGGVGMTFGMRNDRYTVMSIIPGSPAEKGGLLPGDRIVSINGEPTLKLNQNDVVHKIRGQEGTTVTLTVLREFPSSQTMDLPIVRDVIRVETVKSHKFGDIGFIRLNDFTEKCGPEIAKAVDALQKQGVVGLVFDLRNNPGGSLDSAVKIAGIFLKEGQPVVSTEGRIVQMNQTLYAPGSSVRTTLPTVVLINEGSASASEVVTGALQDYGRVMVMGTQSYGKASVQRPYPLSQEGDMLKITGQRYLTPLGRFIDGIGLTPEILETGEVNPPLIAQLQYRECFERCIKEYVKTQPDLKEDHLDVPDHLPVQLMDYGLRGGVLMEKADVEKNRALLKRYLRIELARVVFGEKAGERQTTKEDPMVQHAMDLLHVLQANSQIRQTDRP